MPQVARTRNRRRLTIATTAIVAILLLVICTALYVHHQRQSSEQEFAQLTSITADLIAHKETEKAADMWTNYARDTSNQKSYRAQAWQNAGLIYMSTAQYTRALNCFQSSEPLAGNLTFNLASQIANANMRAGNKAEAVQYFQDALRLMPKSLPNYSDKQQIINDEIKQLQSRP